MSIGLFYTILVLGFVLILCLGIFLINTINGDQELEAGCGFIVVLLLAWAIGFGGTYGCTALEQISKVEIIPAEIFIDKGKTFKTIIINSDRTITLREAKYVNNKVCVYKIEEENRWGCNSVKYKYEIKEEENGHKFDE